MLAPSGDGNVGMHLDMVVKVCKQPSGCRELYFRIANSRRKNAVIVQVAYGNIR
jgi:hypothetical protein